MSLTATSPSSTTSPTRTPTASTATETGSAAKPRLAPHDREGQVVTVTSVLLMKYVRRAGLTKRESFANLPSE